MQESKVSKSNLTIAIALIAAIFGIGLSLYSLVHHYQVKDKGATDAFCNISDTLNCDAVASSAYSEFLTIPLGGYGLGFFVACVFLLLAGFTSYRPDFLSLGFAKKASQATMQNGFLLFTLVGTIVSIGLGALSHFAIGKLCPTCLVIYAATIILFVCAFCLNSPLKSFRIAQAIRGSIYALIPVIVLLLATFAIGRIRTPASPMDNADHDHPADSKGSAGQVYNMEVSTSPYSRLGEDFRKGSDDAKVTLVEFADFQCPACADLARTLKQVHEQFGDKVRIVFKNFPLNNQCNPAMGGGGGHPFACDVAVMARCAGQYGRFWQYHDLAFGEQRSLNSQSHVDWAKAVGLTDDQIQTCLKSKDIREKIADDGRLGNEVQVDGTPSLYINGRKYQGRRSPDDIASELAKYL